MDANKNITLLIADDEAAIRNGLSTVVPWEQFGIAIVGTAEDGREAYDIIKACHPDIVITDIRMPGMDGLELMEKIRNEKLQTNFIILSGYGDFKYAQKAIQLGAKNYFLKPIKIDELVTEIRHQKEEILQSDHMNSYSAYLNVKSEPKEKFLKRLLKNEFYSYEEIRDEIESLKLTLDDSPFRVMVFSIREKEDMEPEDEFQQMKFLMDIVSAELQETRCEFLVSGSGELLTIIHAVRPDFLPVDFRFLAARCLNRINRDSTMELLIGIGKEGTRLTECSNSYKTALMCLSYSFYETKLKIFDESVLCTTPPPTAANHMDYNSLLYYITMNRVEEIRQFCREYFSQLLYVPMPPPNFIRGMCIYLITDVLKELGEGMEGGKEFSQAEVILPVNTIRTFEELKAYMEDFLVECAGKQKSRENGPKNQIIQAAEYYIKSHMGEKILAKDVARHVNLSDVYFTSYFKMKTGINFRDYVIRIKMEYAKGLMERMPEMPVAEVAASIGYDDYRSFYRVFKQYTGVNPSDYNRSGGKTP
ncbi:response regulator [Lachnospiraceae bacterium 54-53]